MSSTTIPTSSIPPASAASPTASSVPSPSSLSPIDSLLSSLESFLSSTPSAETFIELYERQLSLGDQKRGDEEDDEDDKGEGAGDDEDENTDDDEEDSNAWESLGRPDPISPVQPKSSPFNKLFRPLDDAIQSFYDAYEEAFISSSSSSDSLYSLLLSLTQSLNSIKFNKHLDNEKIKKVLSILIHQLSSNASPTPSSSASVASISTVYDTLSLYNNIDQQLIFLDKIQHIAKGIYDIEQDIKGLKSTMEVTGSPSSPTSEMLYNKYIDLDSRLHLIVQHGEVINKDQPISYPNIPIIDIEKSVWYQYISSFLSTTRREIREFIKVNILQRGIDIVIKSNSEDKGGDRDNYRCWNINISSTLPQDYQIYLKLNETQKETKVENGNPHGESYDIMKIYSSTISKQLLIPLINLLHPPNLTSRNTSKAQREFDISIVVSHEGQQNSTISSVDIVPSLCFPCFTFLKLDLLYQVISSLYSSPSLSPLLSISTSSSPQGSFGSLLCHSLYKSILHSNILYHAIPLNPFTYDLTRTKLQQYFMDYRNQLATLVTTTSTSFPLLDYLSDLSVHIDYYYSLSFQLYIMKKTRDNIRNNNYEIISPPRGDSKEAKETKQDETGEPNDEADPHVKSMWKQHIDTSICKEWSIFNAQDHELEEYHYRTTTPQDSKNNEGLQYVSTTSMDYLTDYLTLYHGKSSYPTSGNAIGFTYILIELSNVYRWYRNLPSTTTDVSPLIYLLSLRSALSLYLTIPPSYFSNQFDSIPHMAIVYHNDARYIGNLTTVLNTDIFLWGRVGGERWDEDEKIQGEFKWRRDMREQWREQRKKEEKKNTDEDLDTDNAPATTDDEDTITDPYRDIDVDQLISPPVEGNRYSLQSLIPPLLSFGVKYFTLHVSDMKTRLLEYFNQIESFSRLNYPHSATEIMNIIKQISHYLDQQYRIWSGILPMDIVNFQYSRLFILIYEHVTGMILECADLSQSTTLMLHKIIHVLTAECRQKYKGGIEGHDDSMYQYDRLMQIKEILEEKQTLVTLVQGCKKGIFNKIQGEEFIHLVRALFEDSESRVKAIKIIQVTMEKLKEKDRDVKEESKGNKLSIEEPKKE